jgi:hypothetical protein
MRLDYCTSTVRPSVGSELRRGSLTGRPHRDAYPCRLPRLSLSGEVIVHATSGGVRRPVCASNQWTALSHTRLVETEEQIANREDQIAQQARRERRRTDEIQKHHCAWRRSAVSWGFAWFSALPTARKRCMNPSLKGWRRLIGRRGVALNLLQGPMTGNRGNLS